METETDEHIETRPLPGTAEPLVTPEIAALLDQPKRKSRLGQTMVMLVVSVMLFVAAQSFAYGATALHIAIIVGVLFFHELGHLAAMKVAGYRDLSMFFIPFLGAAAGGTKTSASSGQRAFVSLAGPVPGILLGLVAATAWAITHNVIIGYAAMILLVLNLFNLLPVSPLDGGRFMDVVLFSRFPALQLLTGLGFGGLLAFLAYANADWFLGALAFFSIFGGFSRFNASKLGRAARPIVGDRPPAESIPEDLREPLARVVAANIPPDVLAHNRTTQIAARMKVAWEHATLRPPGAGITLLALGGYIAAFAVPAVFALIVVVATSHSGVIVTDSKRIASTGMLGLTSAEIELDEDNRYHGSARLFRLPSGQLWIEGQWREGYREGTWTVFDMQGELEGEITFARGVFQSAQVKTTQRMQKRAFHQLPADWDFEQEQTEPYVFREF